MSDRPQADGTARTGSSWRVRLLLVLFVACAVAVIWVTNQVLTDRYTVSTKNRSELRQALYAGNLISELQRKRLPKQMRR